MFASCQRVKWNDMQCPVIRRTAVHAVAAILLLTALAACSSSSDADRGSAAANTVATEPAPTTTTNPYAVPAVIDAAYVNRVLAGLDAELGHVTRLIVGTRTIPPEAYDRLRSVYGADDWLQLRLDSFQSDMRRGFAGYLSEPGNPRTTVVELISVSTTCIFARVKRDYSAVGPGATSSSERNWIGLRPVDPSRDPKGYNTTRWAFSYDGFPPDRSAPPNPCVA
jgi:hypothetical protein